MSNAREDWSARWAQGQIGFHEGKPNDLLAGHVDVLERGRGKLRVLVPLAGKAEDLWWLAERGHAVVGIEFVRTAVEAFFAARGLDMQARAHALGPYTAFTEGGVTMLCEDFFALTPEAIGTFDAIYDRAALIAVDPSMRARYVQTCRALAKPGAPTLLVALAYDQSLVHGPPWSTDRATVQALYDDVTVLHTRTVAAPGRMGAAGVASVEETAYLVS